MDKGRTPAGKTGASKKGNNVNMISTANLPHLEQGSQSAIQRIVLLVLLLATNPID